ncbi:MAG: hypothetical protein HOQ20_02865 [Bradyrhizobium sp.]|nr:hypothetical protein [Bradyrhizobium sp.]
MSTVSDERTTKTEGTGQMAGGDPRRTAGRHGVSMSTVGGVAQAQHAVTYLLKPSSRWVRIPSGTLLVLGGVLSFLPVLGVWMLPLGLALLAEDVPALRSSRAKVLDWVERKKPHWLDPAASKNDQS